MNISRQSCSVTVGAALFSCSAVWAAPVSITGSELYALGQQGFLSFPTTPPTVQGSSLLFGSGVRAFEKLVSLPVYQGVTGSGGIEIRVTMNLTMRSCEGDRCNEPEDWDPLFLLGDGSTLFGVQLANDGSLYIEKQRDSGTTGTRLIHDGFFSGVAPELDEAVDVEFLFTVTASSTSVFASYYGASQTYSTGQFLNARAGLSFVFMRDNDYGERHQINSITVDAPGFTVPVPEPPSALLFGIGLAGIGAMRRKTLKK